MGWEPSLGARVKKNGVCFRVWAPLAETVDVVIEEAKEVYPMARDEKGYYRCEVQGVGVGAGARYRYRMNRDRSYPDPASRFQPEGVHGPSQVVDPNAFRWSDRHWRGIRIEDLILYELHVGTFTPAGTFKGLEEKLPALADLGVTAIELMPVADFAGNRNWGYDGVDLFAPSRAYGRPDDLRRCIDTAHRLEIAVFLDVVYNHLGPEGAYLRAFSPFYFTDRRRTPWGEGINLDGEQSGPVRDFFIENALHWIHEYHIDGLRLDATHAMIDDSRPSFLAELTRRARASVSGRDVMIIAEDDRNLARLVKTGEEGDGLDAVWSDDFHHQIRRLLAGDHEGYFRDFSGSIGDLAVTVRQGWFFSGQHSEYFKKTRGTDPSGIPFNKFVFFIQNHDQIGNRAMGERLNHQIDLAAYRAAAVLLICAPETPLLFMGQEWAASAPFLYFTDHPPELGRLVTEGRRNEFIHFSAFSDPDALKRIPDPQDPATFAASRLLWPEREAAPHAATLRLYRALLALRRSDPALRSVAPEDVTVAAIGEGTLLLERRAAGSPPLLVIVQLKDAGIVDLRAQPDLESAPGSRWEKVLTTEEESFSLDPSQPRIDLSAPAPIIQFARPGAVILREKSTRSREHCMEK